MGNSNYIAVNEQITTAGAIVWWRLSGDVSLERLAELWNTKNLNVDLLPNPPSASTALFRACNEYKKPRVLVRPLPNAGWSIVDETVSGKDLTHSQRLSAFLSADQAHVDVQMHFSFSGTDTPTQEIMAQEINERFKAHLLQLSAQDLSQWVVRLLDRMGAVSLRDRGGIYFIPKDCLDFWSQLRGIITDAHADNRLFSVPALRSEDAVQAILDAVEREAAELAQGISGEMAEGEKPLGARALHNRKEKLIAMDAKLAHYEELLGQKTPVFRDLVVKVGAGVTAALLAALSEEQ